MKRKAKDAEDKDKLLKRLKEFLNDLDEGRVDVRQPLDGTDGVGECLADLHHKYLHLLKDLENERKKGKQQQKQVLYLVSFVINNIISTDEDPSLRIGSSAIINLRGVSTKLNKYIVFTMQTYKKLKTGIVDKDTKL